MYARTLLGALAIVAVCFGAIAGADWARGHRARATTAAARRLARYANRRTL